MKERIGARLDNVIDATNVVDTPNKPTGVALANTARIDPCSFRFDGMNSQQIVSLVNRDIGQYYSIELRLSDDGHWSILTRYGKIGRKCARPGIRNFTNRSSTVSIANSTMTSKRVLGYVIDSVCTEGITTYVRTEERP